MRQLVVDGKEVRGNDPEGVGAILRATQLAGGVSVCPRDHLFTGPKCRECWDTLVRMRATRDRLGLDEDVRHETRRDRQRRGY